MTEHIDSDIDCLLIRKWKLEEKKARLSGELEECVKGLEEEKAQIRGELEACATDLEETVKDLLEKYESYRKQTKAVSILASVVGADDNGKKLNELAKSIQKFAASSKKRRDEQMLLNAVKRVVSHKRKRDENDNKKTGSGSVAKGNVLNRVPLQKKSATSASRGGKSKKAKTVVKRISNLPKPVPLRGDAHVKQVTQSPAVAKMKLKKAKNTEVGAPVPANGEWYVVPNISTVFQELDENWRVKRETTEQKLKRIQEEERTKQEFINKWLVLVTPDARDRRTDLVTEPNKEPTTEKQ